MSSSPSEVMRCCGAASAPTLLPRWTRSDMLQRHWGEVTVDDLASMAFPAGSMRPKVTGGCEFVRSTGNRAAIGSLGDVAEVFAGTRGTQVQP